MAELSPVGYRAIPGGLARSVDNPPMGAHTAGNCSSEGGAFPGQVFLLGVL